MAETSKESQRGDGPKNRGGLPNRLWRFARWPLLVALILVALAGVSLAFVTYTTAGNDLLQTRIESYVSSKIAGTLKLRKLRHIEGLKFRAANLKFLPPQRKQPAIDLDGVVIELAWASIEKGWLIVPHASVESGTVRLQLAPSGSTTLEEVFDSTSASSDGSQSESFGVDFRQIDVASTKFLAHIDKFKFRARDLSGRVSILRDPASPGVVVEIKALNGQHTYPEVIGNKFTLRNISGRVQGGQALVIDLDGSAHSESNDVPFRFRYWKDPKTKVVANIHRERTSFAFDIATRIGDVFVLPDFVDLVFEDGDS